MVDEVRLVLADVLGYARGMNWKVRPEDEALLRGGPFEGAYVVRVGEERTSARFFLILPDAIPLLGGYMPDEEHEQLRMRHEGAVPELRAAL